MDVFEPEKRSDIMRRVRSEGTKPEIAVRKLVSGMALRYRLHSKMLLGHPDLVFSRLHKVIFVHGGFWHGHACPADDVVSSGDVSQLGVGRAPPAALWKGSAFPGVSHSCFFLCPRLEGLAAPG